MVGYNSAHYPTTKNRYAFVDLRSPIDLYSSIRINYVCDVEYIMGLARIIFNKLNKTLWYVTLSVVWFHTIRDLD